MSIGVIPAGCENDMCVIPLSIAKSAVPLRNGTLSSLELVATCCEQAERLDLE
jgi:hypothetical protein